MISILLLLLFPLNTLFAMNGLTTTRTATPDERLKALAITLPDMPAPVGHYRPYAIADNMIYISQVALKNGKILNPGALKSASDIARGQEAAQQTILNVLAVVKQACGGTLNCVEQIVRLDGYIASTPQFFDQPKVMDAASNILVDIFGEKGIHARSAVGATSLPLNSPIEITAMIKLIADHK